MVRAHALLNTRQGLGVPAQCACDDRIKVRALRTPVFAQTQTLLLAQGAELVVVSRPQ